MARHGIARSPVRPLVRLCLVLMAMLVAAAGDDGMPRSLTGQSGDAARGRAIVANRQIGLCVLCHAGPFPEMTFQGTIGPNLSGVGGRLTESEIRMRIVNARQVNPTSVMPAYFITTGLHRVAAPYIGKPILSATQIEDVVSYLTTLRTDP